MQATMSEPDDPYLWLEEIDSPAVLDWIEAHNASTLAALTDGEFIRDEERLGAALGAPDKIPYAGQCGDYFYNFWHDEAHPRGLWRRTTMASYCADHPTWETIIDVDALGQEEGESWVWQGCVTLAPEHRRGLVALSRGGADARVLREFDLVTRQFVVDGFVLPESKSCAFWVDVDTLLVASPLGAGHATRSGYPRTVRRWRRGAPFEAAEVIFEGRDNDFIVYGSVDDEPGFGRTVLVRRPSFLESEIFLLDGAGEFRRLDVPSDADAQIHREWLTIRLRSQWQPKDRVFAPDSILIIGLDVFLSGGRDFSLLFEPRDRRAVHYTTWARSRLAICVLDNMKSEVLVAEPDEAGWRVAPLIGVAETETVWIWCAGSDRDGSSEDFFLLVTGYLTPASLHRLAPGRSLALLKRAPIDFDATRLTVSRHEAVAEDGVPIPYVQVGPRDMPLDGDNPTVLYGYGGFSASLLPAYNPAIGVPWLERGGVYVVANTRGGGEFGTAWHKAGIRAGKKRAQDDFAVVARDLIARGVTSAPRLGCFGLCNGGLLVGNMLTRFPQLFGAGWCEMPVLDLRRFTKLLTGAVWIEEYGDPDNPEDWAYLKEISPYHLVERGGSYPPFLLWTSRRDDQTHPAHARKMAARLEAFGHRALFYEPAEGGHGTTDFRQAAHMYALGFSFFRQTIGVGAFAFTAPH
jgi:prolyl oligopeptidase